MPIYEYYCPDNHTVYQFYAKTLAQGRTIPPCPDHPGYRMQKLVSSFAVTRGRPDPAVTSADGADSEGLGDAAEAARMTAAMQAMEREFSSVDETDPRAMGRMMRRMAELTGEKLDGEMEAVVRRLEEGADPESLEAELGSSEDDASPPADAGLPAQDKREPKHRYRLRRALPPRRDPHLHDYPG